MTGYVLGETAGEHRRLERQAEVMTELTRSILARAGVGEGMRVLDVGCGPGDVSLIAAGLVGPSGSVVGIDRDPAGLDRARARAEAAGLTHVAFVEADMHAGLPEGRFDAIVGRLVLMYTPDPAALLTRFAGLLGPGGILAFQETDIGAAKSVPPVPSIMDNLERIRETFRRAGANPSMALSLDRAFRGAGMIPEMVGGTALDACGEGFCPAWVSSTVRSLLPRMEALGVATAAEIDPDTLESRMRAELREAQALHVGPLMVGAWARVPGAA